MLLIRQQQSSEKEFRRRRKISRANRKVRDRRENAMRKDLRKVWNGIRQTVEKRVERIGKTGFSVEEIFRPPEFRNRFNSAFIPHVARTLFTGAQFELDHVRSMRSQSANRFQHLLDELGLDLVAQQTEPTDIELPPGFNVELTPTMQKRVADVLSKREVAVWSRVGNTTRDALQRSIERGIQEGLPFDVMQKQIGNTLGGLSRTQPIAIARTETTLAMNNGSQIERDELQIRFKEWASTIDSRNRGMDPKSRFDHISPDGQVVANKDPFRVSGEMLMYPADGSRGASAGNIINCRCASIAALRAPSPQPPQPKRKPSPAPKKRAPKPKPQPEPEPVPAPGSAGPPEGITFTGEESPFSRRVWSTIREEGVDREAKVRRIGRLVREEAENNNAALRTTKKELRDAENELDKLLGRLAEESDDSAAEVLRNRASSLISRRNSLRVDIMEKAKEQYPKELQRVRDFGGRLDGVRTASDDLVEFFDNELSDTHDIVRRNSVATQVVRKAADDLPTDWVRRIENRKINVVESARGFHVDSGGMGSRGKSVLRSLGEDPDDFEIIGVGTGRGARQIATHELIHSIETADTRLFRLQDEFLERRKLPGETVSEIYKGSREVGIKDGFPDHYIGRIYEGSPHREVAATGWEGLRFGKMDVANDDDLTDFVLGLVAAL